MDIIKVNDLNKSFNDVKVLKNINLSIKSGTVTSIIGPSGSGKSTLLRCLNQLESVTSGYIFLNGEDITSNKTNLNKVRVRIGMVFQSFNLFNNLTVLENLILGQAKVLRRTSIEANEIASGFLKQVGMIEFQNRKVTTLSGGQKQRVAIARSLSMNPEIILFDEPTSSLDPEMVNDVLEVMKSIISKDITFIVVTHEMEFAKEISDRILFMEEGQITSDGKPEEIWSSSSNDRLKKYLNI